MSGIPIQGRASPARPSIERLSSSYSTGFADDTDLDDGETVRSFGKLV